MRWIRSQLAHVAAGWLVFQFSLLVSVPTTLCSMHGPNVAGVECTCAHENGGMCPMHHSRTHVHGGTHPCSCRSASDPMTALAAVFSGPPAVLAAEESSIASPDAGICVPAALVRPPAWISVPDSPPPRS